MADNAYKIYDFVVQAFRRRSGWTAGLSFEERLATLKPSVSRLRTDMRNSHVRIDYQGDLCDAYTLVYFPPYAHTFLEILNRVGVKSRRPTLRVCVLGAGPAPEVWAIDNHCRASGHFYDSIQCTLIDLRTDAWSPARDAIISAADRTSPNTVTQQPIAADLGDPSLAPQLAREFSTTDLVVMQNVFNELPEPAWITFQQTFQAALKALPPGAQVIVNDLTETGTNRLRLAALQELVSQGLEITRPALESSERWDTGPYLDAVPEILRRQLLTDIPGSSTSGSLIPKRYVSFDFFAAGVPAVAMPPERTRPILVLSQGLSVTAPPAPQPVTLPAGTWTPNDSGGTIAPQQSSGAHVHHDRRPIINLTSQTESGAPVAEYQILPFYAVCDESGSMLAFIDDLNDALAKLHQDIASDPIVADKAYFSLIGFSTTPEVLLPLSDLSDQASMPGLTAKGTTEFGAAFTLLKQTIEADVARLKADGARVYRPAVFFMSDGMPTDSGWRTPLQGLLDPAFKQRPNIITFGFNEANADNAEAVETLKAIATREAWLLEKGADPGGALREWARSLTSSIVGSVTQSTDGSMNLVVPPPPPGVRVIPVDEV